MTGSRGDAATVVTLAVSQPSSAPVHTRFNRSLADLRLDFYATYNPNFVRPIPEAPRPAVLDAGIYPGDERDLYALDIGRRLICTSRRGEIETLPGARDCRAAHAGRPWITGYTRPP